MARRHRAGSATPAVDRLPPHSTEAEQGIIGCVLLEPNVAFEECLHKLKAGGEEFYDLRYQTIYGELVAMHKAKIQIDVITLQQRLKDNGMLEQIGGIVFLAGLPETVPSAANLGYYLEIVLEKYTLRKLVQTCTGVVGRVYDYEGDVDKLVDEVEKDLSAVIESARPADDTVSSSRTAVEMLTNHLEERMNLKGQKSGIVTGLNSLDRLIDGLQYGEQTIIGARPSQGKTALATTIINRACLIDKIPTLVITLEMSIPALCRRLLSNHCKIPMNKLKSGDFDEGDFKRFTTFSSLLNKSPIHFMDAIGGSDSGRICATIKRMAKTHGIKLVVIDYLQKIAAVGKHEKRTYEVAQVSGALKAAAKNSGVALLTLAQLNRESEQQKGRSPRLSDLADSSQIERDGDTIALLERNREPGNDHQARLHIAKQRDGEIGTIDLHFEGKYCLFENRTWQEEE